MKEKLVRYSILLLSVFLLAASIGVIVWISRDESVRLVDRERAAIAAAEKAAVEVQVSGGIAETSDPEKLIRDIDTLLSSLSSDDLPDDD